MVMDSGLRELSGMMSGLCYDDSYLDQNIFPALGLGGESQTTVSHSDYVGSQRFSIGISQISTPTSSVCVSSEGESTEDGDIFYSDMALNYISRMLMEEDIDEKVRSYKEESVIRAAEKPFYDILSQKYPPSPDRPPLDVDHIFTSSSGRNNDQFRNFCSGSDFSDHRQLCSRPGSVDYSPQTSSSSSSSLTSFDDHFNHVALSPDVFFQSIPAWHFKRGVEEAQKFLPSNDKLGISSESNCVSASQMQTRDNTSRVRKSTDREDLDLVEGRSNKLSAVFPEGEVRSEIFDMILLGYEDKRSKKMSALREAMQNEANKNGHNDSAKASSGGDKSRGKKHTKKEVVDLRALLILCAQAVAADDRRTANELLKQIRQHSSPNGDGTQRLAQFFADGLEARLAGTGSRIYQALVAKRATTTDVLKAYHLYLAACPFKRISHFFSNQTILDLAEKASKLHIIDFGIYFGFQWPCLIQRLSTREGGSPKLRITGIDVPQPGFRPTERIEETGRRLADYAKSFNVPFEYQAIASRWEAIRAEDLHIAEDEVVAVNCLYRFRNLIDETVVVDSPRNRVLDTIRKMNPDVFIHGVVNGSYSAPFFVTRFREALFHYSALFDMLEANVPRDDDQRSLIERDLFGREALNVIACEGSERVERPETYKQWQVRNLRAGFEQLSLNVDIMKRSKDKVKGSYHNDFVIDEDNGWLIQGWKGRIIYAISAWKPNGA
ncbi:scarecrow-like protein 9 [Curcuma longa]|uniref:scarecrow-like protein 9 n=1 Tax=Curcuma longa TaxID=136217 RepID=UPI003D9EA1CF